MELFWENGKKIEKKCVGKILKKLKQNSLQILEKTYKILANISEKKILEV